jgi:16S rRNA (adenine1518-N6/adenine1519-N6)-dimethyltransferase
VVKASFGKRRKTLKNSLSSSIFGDIDFSDSGVDLSLRAEQLSLNDFLRLAESVKKTETGLLKRKDSSNNLPGL